MKNDPEKYLAMAFIPFVLVLAWLLTMGWFIQVFALVAVITFVWGIYKAIENDEAGFAVMLTILGGMILYAVS